MKTKSEAVYDQKARDIVARLKRHIPPDEYRDKMGWTMLGPVIFAALCFGALYVIVVALKVPVQDVITYKAPEYIGIVAVYSPHRYKIINVATQQTFLVDTCHSSNEQWYAGHVMSWVAMLNTGKCQLMGPKGLGYRIVREDFFSPEYQDWQQRYGYLTHSNGLHRPVLAANCHNTLDDTGTVCTGGEANFIKESDNAQSARQSGLSVSFLPTGAR